MTSFEKAIVTAAFLIVSISWPEVRAQIPPAIIDIAKAPIPIQILVQSPADTTTNLQVICLFRSSPLNTLHGSLAEINEKLKGLLERVRNPELFRGELGETLLIAPPLGSIGARKLLIIGLGDSQTFSPQRMQLVGQILYREAINLGVERPFFAPTILDGGVTKFTTGQVAQEVISGFLRAAATDKALKDANASAGGSVNALTYLAGAANTSNTREGIEKAISGAHGDSELAEGQALRTPFGLKLGKQFYRDQSFRGIGLSGKELPPFAVAVFKRRSRSIGGHVRIFDHQDHRAGVRAGYGTAKQSNRLRHDRTVELRIGCCLKLGHEVRHATRFHIVFENREDHALSIISDPRHRKEAHTCSPDHNAA